VKIESEKITGSTKQTPAAPSGTRRGRGTPVLTSGADEVLLSSRAEEFRRVRPQLEFLPESGHDKIAQIKSQIQEKTYHVSGNQIAEAMLRDQSTVELLGLGSVK
jgi:flagellar biosynthesis anti-sigma factor FlgM